jgi:hypothetical protein
MKRSSRGRIRSSDCLSNKLMILFHSRLDLLQNLKPKDLSILEASNLVLTTKSSFTAKKLSVSKKGLSEGKSWVFTGL